jgi:hypothetical protein
MPLYVRHLPGSIQKLVNNENLPQNHAFFNPSIAWPIMYIRQEVHFPTKHENHIILVNMETQKQTQIATPFEMLTKTCNLYVGLEDLRICWYEGKLWFTATSTHASDSFKSEMMVGHFDAALTKIERISYVDVESKPAKNICPYVHDGKLLIIDMYCMNVFQIVDVCSEDGGWVHFGAVPYLKLAYGEGIHDTKYRGSSSPVHIHGNTWGMVVHDIIFNDQSILVTQLSYMHHWVEFDVVTGVVSFISSPFWLAHWGVEFVSGIRLRENGGVTLLVGIQDKSAIAYETTLYNLRVGK